MNTSKLFFKEDEIDPMDPTIGAKTKGLLFCRGLGLTVPEFVAVSSDRCEMLFTDAGARSELARVVRSTRPCGSYAVRSSALVEDGNVSSHAGMFLTVCDVMPSDLEYAIHRVLENARERLEGDLHRFSFIIQEYIEADYAGVTFTRDPLGARDMVIEYREGDGEKIVGGTTHPNTIRLAWSEMQPRLPTGLAYLARGIESFKEIERARRAPQDIEWCVRKAKMFFLQTRPITTVNRADYELFLQVDMMLPKAFYFLEKTEATEVAPRARPLTLSLLEHISKTEGGPLAKTYDRFGIRYAPANPYVIAGSELFIDRECELKTLLPSVRYIAETFKPSLRLGRGALITLKNLFFLSLLPQRANMENARRLANQLQKALASDRLNPANPANSIAECIRDFFEDYELIFEINVLCTASIKQLARHAASKGLSTVEILADTSLLPDEQFDLNPNSDWQSLRGNGFEIDDSSQFAAFSATNRASPQTIAKPSLESVRRAATLEFSKRAAAYNRLREAGRWLTILHINRIRKSALAYSANHGFKNPTNIYFATCDELISETALESNCIKRRFDSERFAKLTLPKRLTSAVVFQESDALVGVSAGKAEGQLMTLEEINARPSERGILYTDSLTPDLSSHFGKLSGIASNNGGLLSHLAILAREARIPVIVGFRPNSSVSIGARVLIDGSIGQIRVISPSQTNQW